MNIDVKRIPVMVVEIHEDDGYKGGYCGGVNIKSKVLYIDNWNELKLGMWAGKIDSNGWWRGNMFVSANRIAPYGTAYDDISAENGMIEFHGVKFKIMLEPEEYFLLI